MNGIDELLGDVRYFMKNRVVMTAVELGIFDIIGSEPGIMAGEVAKAISADIRATTRLLDCLVGLKFLKKEKEEYFLEEAGNYLTSNHPQTVVPVIHHYIHLWENWSYLTDTIVQGKNIHKRSVFADEKRLRAFIGAMHSLGRSLAYEIAEYYDASDRKVLLDIGGGSGIYTIAFLKQFNHLEAVLFDLPEVIPIAEKYIALEGLENRVSFVAGNFYADPLPEGCDFALLSAIIHQNGPEENIRLYSSIFDVLPSGGKVLIRDHVMEEDRTFPPAGALFALNMLVNTDRGDTYTFSEIKSHLEEAGFANVKLLKQGNRMDCLVEAVKP